MATKPISLIDAQKRASETLAGFPAPVVAAYLVFAEQGDPESLDIVVLGVLQFYLAKRPTQSIGSLPGSTRLVEDLGFDSLTMMDTVFMLESLLEIKIDDEELARLSTLDDLRAHLRQHFKGSDVSAA